MEENKSETVGSDSSIEARVDSCALFQDILSLIVKKANIWVRRVFCLCAGQK